jgi:hypothetical protein
MSSPKEKAEELYCNYDSLFKAPFKKHQQLKDCCLIAVDEIINWHIEFLFITQNSVGHEYWQEVKQEIENL